MILIRNQMRKEILIRLVAENKPYLQSDLIKSRINEIIVSMQFNLSDLQIICESIVSSYMIFLRIAIIYYINNYLSSVFSSGF
jgi:hypothetical protein